MSSSINNNNFGPSRDRFTFEVQTFKPIFENESETVVTPTQPEGAKKKKFIRTDGRIATKFRPLFIKTDVVTQSSGSCYIELGKTKIFCSIQGPRQKAKMQVSEEGRVSCDMRYAAFSSAKTDQKANIVASTSTRTRGRSARDTDTDSEEREATMAVLNSIEPSVRLSSFPKSIVDLNVLVLENDGSVLAASCVACSIALVNAGIEVFDLVSACCVAKVNGVMIVDPTAEEEKMATGGLVVGMMHSLGEITQLYQFGELSQEDIIKALELCEDGCGQIYKLMKKSLVDSQSK